MKSFREWKSGNNSIAERLLALHRTSFPTMSITDFANQIIAAAQSISGRSQFPRFATSDDGSKEYPNEPFAVRA